MKAFTKDYPEKKNVQKRIRDLVTAGEISETTALKVFDIMNSAAASAYNAGYTAGVVAATPGPGPEVPAFMLRQRRSSDKCAAI